MVRFSFTLATLAIVFSTASDSSELSAQQVIYSGQVIYSQSVPTDQVAPYPIAAPIEYSSNSSSSSYSTGEVIINQSPAVVSQSAVSQSTLSTIATPSATTSATVTSATVTSRVNHSGSTSLMGYRKSTTMQAQPASTSYSTPAPQATSYTPVYSQPAPAVSAPVINTYQPSAPTSHAPSFFAPQNCFSGS